MATEWKAQQGDGKYRLQFETDDKEKYKLVEKAAQMAVDGKTYADFVEVVRCKDCENYVPLGDAYEFKGRKAMHCWLEGKPTSENYYCADGRRKDDE